LLDTSQPSASIRRLLRFSDTSGDPWDVFNVGFEAENDSIFINLAFKQRLKCIDGNSELRRKEEGAKLFELYSFQVRAGWAR
jgi:hypothetical protein